MLELEGRQPEDVAVDETHPLDPPVLGDLLDGGVDFVAVLEDAQDQPAAVVPGGLRRPLGFPIGADGGLGLGRPELELVEDLERGLARPPAFAHGPAQPSLADLRRFSISTTEKAASQPLLPDLVPARSIPCSIVSTVRIPKAQGTP